MKNIVNYLPLTVFDALEMASILLVILAQAVERLTKELKDLRREEHPNFNFAPTCSVDIGGDLILLHGGCSSRQSWLFSIQVSCGEATYRFGANQLPGSC